MTRKKTYKTVNPVEQLDKLEENLKAALLAFNQCWTKAHGPKAGTARLKLPSLDALESPQTRTDALHRTEFQLCWQTIDERSGWSVGPIHKRYGVRCFPVCINNRSEIWVDDDGPKLVQWNYSDDHPLSGETKWIDVGSYRSRDKWTLVVEKHSPLFGSFEPVWVGDDDLTIDGLIFFDSDDEKNDLTKAVDASVEDCSSMERWREMNA